MKSSPHPGQPPTRSRIRKPLNQVKILLTLLAIAGNLWVLLPQTAPLAISHLGSWLSATRWWQVCALLIGLVLVLPPFWASRRYRRVAGWMGGVTSLLLLFNIAILTGLSYLAAMYRPESRPTNSPGEERPPLAQPTPTPARHDPTPAQPTPTPTPLPPAKWPTPQPRVAGATPRHEDWRETDRHALAAPPEAEVNVTRLARYLTQGAKNDRQKVRAIYRWVTDRIAYDSQSFFANSLPDGSPETTLKRRMAVCDGVSRLVQALLQEAGVPGEIVSGFARGIERPGQADERENHAWNAVQLDEQWFLLDATWGAGQIGDDRKFQKEFHEFYFLTPPDQLLNTHYPSDELWQLRPRPLSWENFQAQPRLREDYYALGLKLVNNPKSQLIADPQAVVELTAPESVHLSAQLKDTEGSNLEGTTAVYREGQRARFHLKAPRPGKYEFHLYAAPRADVTGGSVKLKGIAEFQVDAKSGDESGFPSLTLKWAERRAHLKAPLQGRLPSGMQHFEMEVPGAQKVFLNDWPNLLQRNGQRFSGDFNLKPGKAEIYAQFDDDKAEGILVYEVLPP